MLRTLLSRLGETFRRPQLDEEFDEELHDHLQMVYESIHLPGHGPDRGLVCGTAPVRRSHSNKPKISGPRSALPAIDVLIWKSARRLSNSPENKNLAGTLVLPERERLAGSGRQSSAGNHDVWGFGRRMYRLARAASVDPMQALRSE